MVDTILFEQAIIIGRFISAILTILAVFLTYKFTLYISDKNTARLSVIFSVTSVGLLQYSHFSTFEMWLTFFTLLMVFMYTKFLKSSKLLYFITGSLIFGLLCGLKTSSIALILIPLFIIIATTLRGKFHIKKLINTGKHIFILIYCSALAYIITSPYNLIDTNAFLGSMNYEGGVAMGSLPVFYTGAFFNQIPVFFQYIYSLPFLINPAITIISIASIIYLAYLSIKKKNIYIGFLIFSLLTIFIPQSVVFAKWTRYLIPSIPFIYILSAIFLIEIKRFLPKTAFYFLTILIVGVSIIYFLSFIKTVTLPTDTRIEAYEFAKKNINPQKNILSEVYDLGITPFNPMYNNIRLYNFYDLDNGITDDNATIIQDAEYIILPSQRIYKSRSINSENFPVASGFYSKLFSEKKGFKKIYQTECDIFCKIIYMGNPVFNVEDTVNVFDRPTVYIFKKK